MLNRRSKEHPPGARRPRTLAAMLVAAIGLAGAAALPQGGAVAQEEAFQVVPAASCAEGDRTETVQGQTTLAERFARGPAAAFNCNTALVGQYKGEGAGWGWNVFGDCAYVTQFRTDSRTPKLSTPGTLVIDAADPAAPALATVLTSLTMMNANESLTFSAARNLMVANNVPLNGETEFPFEVYDVSDCRNPQPLFSAEMPGNMRFHGGQFDGDGNIFYAVSCYCAPFNPYGEADSAFFAIDMTDPAQPKEIARWLPDNPNWKTHWVTINEDATRAYISLIELQPGPHDNGIVILDISDISSHKPDPQIRLVSSLFWEDVGFGEGNLYFRKDGRAYVLHTDLRGTRSFGGGVQDAGVCVDGKSGWGYPRIIDVTDEQAPETVARLALAVHDPARCAEFALDPIGQGGYSSAFCDVERPVDPRLLACGYMEGGLRIFDIRDLKAPKEIAYYKPAATRTEPMAASPRLISVAVPINTADAVVVPKFRDGGREVWFNAMDNGLMMVRLSDAFIAANADLFAD